MNTSVRGRHLARGFGMVELLVSIVFAGIIFAALVPFFANALKRTSGDEFRVDSTSIVGVIATSSLKTTVLVTRVVPGSWQQLSVN